MTVTEAFDERLATNATASSNAIGEHRLQSTNVSKGELPSGHPQSSEADFKSSSTQTSATATAKSSHDYSNALEPLSRYDSESKGEAAGSLGDAQLSRADDHQALATATARIHRFRQRLMDLISQLDPKADGERCVEPGDGDTDDDLWAHLLGCLPSQDQ